MTADELSRLLTKEQVAKLCQVSRRTVTTWQRTEFKDFPKPEVIGKILLVWFREEVEAWLKTAEIKPRVKREKRESPEDR